MPDYIADYCRYLTEEKHAQKNTLNSYARDLNQFQTISSDTRMPVAYSSSSMA